MQDDLSGFQGKLSELVNQKDPPVGCATPPCITLDRRKAVECGDPEDFEFEMLKIIELFQQKGRLQGVVVETKFEMEAPNLLLLGNS